MSDQTINAKAYDELAIGDAVQVERTITTQDIQLFAAVSGDCNPVHLDPAFAATTAFGEPIAHGMLCGALISATIAMHLPGPGSVYRSQQIKFSKPVFVGDRLSVAISVADKKDRSRLVTLDCKVSNQDERVVASGTAEVIAPESAQSVALAALPRVCLDEVEYNN